MRSLLETDGYKFSMAEAGWPLRTETFYYSHRRGGPHYLPFDVPTMIRSLLPNMGPHTPETGFLESQGYRMGGGFYSAMRALDDIKIDAIPKRSWFFDREPVFTITGPSALVSWLEPLVLQLHYRIQVATEALLRPETLPDMVGTVTCEAQRQIVLETLDAVGVPHPEIRVDEEGYHNHVHGRVAELIQILEDPARIFEVGMRAASCSEQHRIALTAAKDAGLRGTSNVLLAAELNIRAVGTMGHEHVQRYGNDEAAFRAMRDRFPGDVSFLLDTFSTMKSGLPTAIRLLSEIPGRRDTVRFDSGDKITQYLVACSMAKSAGVNARFILEDSFNADLTREFEKLRAFTGVTPEDQLYGYGGYIVKAPGDPLTRDRVAAVYKLTQSGPNATMKFGDEPGAGKESIPGKPVLYRRYTVPGWQGFVAQEGEYPDHINGDVEHISMFHPGYAASRRLHFTAGEAVSFQQRQGRAPTYSPETQRLVSKLYAARDHHIREA